SKEYITKAIGMIKERAGFINDLWDQSFFFYMRPESYVEKSVQKFWKPETSGLMNELHELLESQSDFQSEVLEPIVINWITEKEYKMGGILNAFRVALVGEAKGPHLFDITAMLGKEESILRLRKAIEVLK
ncbi:MAG TPA: glutamate--tRNA ligase, partial [Bacteroidales bacterium]